MTSKTLIILIVSVLAVISIRSFIWPRLWPSEDLHEIRTFINGTATKSYYPKLKFAISLLNSLEKGNPNENQFYSPQNLYQTLLVTYFGTAGETAKELENVLGLLYNENFWAKNKSQVESAYLLEREKLDQIQPLLNESIDFISVNKFFVSTRVNIT